MLNLPTCDNNAKNSVPKTLNTSNGTINNVNYNQLTGENRK